MAVKRWGDELFMHYFQRISRFLRLQTPIGAQFIDPAGGRKPLTP